MEISGVSSSCLNKMSVTMDGFRLDEWIPQYTELLDRSSHRRCSVKKCIFQNFAILTEKNLCLNLF